MFILKTPFRVHSAFLTILFLFSIAVTGVFAKSGDMPLTGTKAARELFVQARDKGENLEDTGTLFDAVIQKDPNFAFAYLFAGQTNSEFRKNLATAVSLADKASAGEREWIFAVRDANNGNNAGQLSHLEQLIKLFPDDKRAQMAVANYYRNIGDSRTALTYLNNAVKIDKKYAPPYNLIGYSNLDLGNFAAAESAFQTYIKLIPNNANPYDSYAEFLMNTGKFDASIVQYNLALAKDPTFVNSYRGIGNDYAYKGDFVKSREAYQSMYTKSTNDANRDLALASTMNSWIVEGNIDKALEVNEQRIAIAEKDRDVGTVIGLHYLAGFILIENGRLDAAAEHYDMAAAMIDDPSLPSETKDNRRFAASIQRSRLLAAQGNFDAAHAELASTREFVSTSSNPNTVKNFNQASGWVELQQKNFAKANEFYAKANMQNPAVWFYQALAADGAGDHKSASILYRKVAEWNQLDTTGYALVRTRAIAGTQK
jgi:tetratricopeptide (TPR) repeat protein